LPENEKIKITQKEFDELYQIEELDGKVEEIATGSNVKLDQSQKSEFETYTEEYDEKQEEDQIDG